MDGYQTRAPLQPGTPLRVGDRVKSGCSDGLLLEIVQVFKAGIYEVVEIRPDGSRAAVLECHCTGSRNDFPSWYVFRKK